MQGIEPVLFAPFNPCVHKSVTQPSAVTEVRTWLEGAVKGILT